MVYLRYIKKYTLDIFKKIYDLFTNSVIKEKDTNRLPIEILPEPNSLEIEETVITLPETITIFSEKDRGILEKIYITIPYIKVVDTKESAFVQFTQKEQIQENSDEYIVDINEKIEVTYTNTNSLFNSAQTLLQIISHKNYEKRGTVSKCHIYDYPTHAWRGLLLDVARHYMPIEFLKEIIVKMAEIKLNVLHIHLTDDQGWRYESLRYPLLHTIGSKRKETVVEKKFFPFMKAYVGDGVPYEGYYTQKELRELVAFAQEYNIEIVPEIDIPGHSTALLAAYPEYAAHHPPKSVATLWGVFNNVLSPEDTTIEFLKNIFSELCEIFPSTYIHIGGDEVPLKNYKKSASVEDMVSRGMLTSYKEAPEYILEKIALHLKSLGRVPVMWNEASPVAQKTNGIVMVWHDLETMKDMEKMKIPYVCSSASHFYLDHYQKPNTTTEPLAIGGYSSLKHVYEANIYKSEYLIGIQANMWTEYTKTPESVEYMIFPRLYAVAEVAWGKYRADLENFLRKVERI